jgi:hypothetical protein
VDARVAEERRAKEMDVLKETLQTQIGAVFANLFGKSGLNGGGNNSI